MSGLASAATLDEIKTRDYMVVVTEDDFRPFEYIQDGKPVGYDNELIEKLLKFVPFEIRVVINSLLSINTIVKEKPDVFAVGEAVAAPAYAAWPVKQGNAELLALISQFLAQERGNGELLAPQNKMSGPLQASKLTRCKCRAASARRAGGRMIRDVGIIWAHRDQILNGLANTVWLSLSAAALGFALGSLLAMVLMARAQPVAAAGSYFLSTRCCVSFLLFAYLVDYGLPSFGIASPTGAPGSSR